MSATPIAPGSERPPTRVLIMQYNLWVKDKKQAKDREAVDERLELFNQMVLALARGMGLEYRGTHVSIDKVLELTPHERKKLVRKAAKKVKTKEK